ncbi:MAG: hypothetical protein WCP53_04020 [Verrucomicrobiota bacterium]
MKSRQAQSRLVAGPSFLFRALILLVATVATTALGAGDHIARVRAEAVFAKARATWTAAPDDVTNAWQFARAAFDQAKWAPDDRHRAAIAEEAIRVCRAAVVRDPRSAPAHYYLGLDLGQLALTRALGGLKLVREMEKHWLAAKWIDETFDSGGPDRSLGLLYFEAPGWPASIGSHAKARTHLEHAVKLAPGFPENRLCLAEALVKWKKRDDAAAQLKELDASWSDAKARHTGDDWISSWMDWEKRLAALKTKMKAK